MFSLVMLPRRGLQSFLALLGGLATEVMDSQDLTPRAYKYSVPNRKLTLISTTRERSPGP